MFLPDFKRMRFQNKLYSLARIRKIFPKGGKINYYYGTKKKLLEKQYLYIPRVKVVYISRVKVVEVAQIVM